MSNKKWTVMVYLAGDNNLTEEMVWALQEMKKAAANKQVSDRVNLIAQYDPRGKNPRTYDIIVDETNTVDAWKNRDGNLDTLPISILSAPQQYDAALRHIVEECYQAATKGNPALKPMLPPAQHVVAEIKKVDQITDRLMNLLPGNCHNNSELKEKMACLFKEISDHLAWNYNASAVLKTFVNQQIRKATHAENYLVVLSGHGSGAIGDFLTDSDPKSALSIPKLRQLLDLIKAEFEDKRSAEFAERKKNGRVLIDILGTDSCLMSMAELCYEIRNYADYLVGSEGFVQNTGWPYHRILESLMIDMDSQNFAATIVGLYTRFYQDYEVAGVSTDISACSLKFLRKPPAFVDRIKELATELTESLKNLTVIHQLEQLGQPPDALKVKTSVALKELKTRLISGVDALLKKDDTLAMLIEDALDTWSKLIDACGELEKNGGNSDKKTELAKTLTMVNGAPLKPEDLSSIDKMGFLSEKKIELLKKKKDELKVLSELIDAGGEFKDFKEDTFTKQSAEGTKILTQLFETALSKCSALEEYLTKAGLENENVLEKLKALMLYKKSAKVEPKNLEPRIVNALVELRLEIELCCLHNPIDFRNALNALDILAARGVSEAIVLNEELRRLADLKRTTELAEAVDLNVPDVTRQKWTSTLHAVHLAHHQAQSYKGDLYTDLYDFCARLAELLPSVGVQCQGIMDAIAGEDPDNRFVITSCYVGPEFQHSHGVSLYFPWNALDYWHEYENLQFAQDTGWDEFLKSYLRATRRERRVAQKGLATKAITLRHGPLPYDPLVKAGTEDRIRVGTEDRIRAGTEDRIRAGTEDRIRAGTEDRIRAGTEDRIRGKMRFSSMKNPPDGFYRCKCECKK